MQKVIDVFIFFNELELLKVRLAFLGPHVDYFVISESDCDFSGKKKEFFLTKELLNTLPFSNKIILHQEKINLHSISWFYKKIKYLGRQSRFLWKIQDAQRNSTLKPLSKFEPNDLVIFGDIDEFPNQNSIDFLKKNPTKLFSCTQQLHYYNINTIADGLNWYGSILTNVLELRRSLPCKIRGSREKFPRLPIAGWHFSYFMSPEKIKTKMDAICDVEKITHHNLINALDIKESIENKKDLFNRNIKYKKPNKLEEVPQELKDLFLRYLPNVC